MPERLCSPSMMGQFAAELEDAFPVAVDTKTLKASALGGIYAKVQKLIADLKASDWEAVVADVRDLLFELLGPETPAPVEAFQRAAATLSIDWEKLIDVLLKILPLILGKA